MPAPCRTVTRGDCYGVRHSKQYTRGEKRGVICGVTCYTVTGYSTRTSGGSRTGQVALTRVRNDEEMPQRRLVRRVAVVIQRDAQAIRDARYNGAATRHEHASGGYSIRQRQRRVATTLIIRARIHTVVPSATRLRRRHASVWRQANTRYNIETAIE